MSVDPSSSEGLTLLREKFREKAHSQNDSLVLSSTDFAAVVEGLMGEDGAPRSDTLSELKTIFDTFDNDRNGSVDLEEFTQGMRILFAGSEKDRLEFAFSGLDYDHDGSVTTQEFLTYFRNYFQAKSALEGRQLEPARWTAIEEHLERVFRGTDADNSGTIDIEEFKSAVRSDPDHPFTLIWHSFTTGAARLRH